MSSQDVRAVPGIWPEQTGGYVMHKTSGNHARPVRKACKYVHGDAIYPLERRILLSASIIRLAATPQNESFVEGISGTIEVASIADVPSTDSPASFAATISWGDKTKSAGTISESGSTFVVTGRHKYAEGGSYKFVVQISASGVRISSVKGLASVSYVPVVVTAQPVGAVAGVAATYTVGSFIDPAGLDKASDYRATISWGDGGASVGKLVANASGGFNVVAAHKFKHAGVSPTSVTVTDLKAAPVIADSDATVATRNDTKASIETAAGGTIQTTSGTAVSIPAGLLGGSTVATVTDLSSATDIPASADLSGTGPAVDIGFGAKAVRGTTDATVPPVAGQNIVATVPSTTAVADATAYVTITTPAGNQVPLVLDSVTSTGSQLTASLPVSTLEAIVPASEISKTTLQFAFTDPNAAAATAATAVSYGAKYFDSGTGAFEPFPTTGLPDGWNADARTIVLVHGFAGTVESTFTASSVAQIVSQGGYTNSGGVAQVIGFDYDFLEDPQTAGGAVAAFLNSLKTLPDPAGNTIRDVDIEGAGTGAVVALAAAGQTSMDVDNLISLGGPLDGTPAADYQLNGINLLETGLLDQSNLPELPSVFGRPDQAAGGDSILGANGSAYDLDSSELQGIRGTFIAHDPDTRVFAVAGTDADLPGLGSAFQQLDPVIFGGGPNDGVVPVFSAEGANPDGTALFPNQLIDVGPTFALNQYQLATDPTVVTGVATAVNARRPAFVSTTPPAAEVIPPAVSGTTVSTVVTFHDTGPANTFSDYRIGFQAAAGSTDEQAVAAAIQAGDIRVAGGVNTGKAFTGGSDSSVTVDILSSSLIGVVDFNVEIFAPGAAASPVTIPISADFIPVLAVTGGTHLLLPGETTRLTVNETDGAGVRVDFNPADIVFSSEDPGVATVDDGTVTGVGDGTTYIDARDTGNGAAGSWLVIVASDIDLEVVPTAATIGVGGQVQLTAIATDNDGGTIPISDLDLQWSSGNGGVAAVDQSGLVTGVSPGVAPVTVTDITPGHGSPQASSQITVLGWRTSPWPPPRRWRCSGSRR
jgi:hypothetical protein